MPERHVVTPRVGVLLETARRRRGLSFRQAGRLAGCSAPHLYLLETGLRAPSTALAVDIAQAYGLDREETIALLSESVDSAGRSRTAL